MSIDSVKSQRVIWMVNHHAKLPIYPGGTRHYGLGEALTNSGWATEVVSSSSILLRIENCDSLEKQPESPNFTWIRCPRYKGNGLGWLLSYAVFTIQVAFGRGLGKLPEPDAVMGSTVHLSAAWAGKKFAKKFSVPFVLEVRDLWPETLIEMGTFSRDSLPARTLYRLEGNLAKSADLIVSPLSGVGEYLREHHGTSKAKFLHISNGVDLDNTQPAESQPNNGELRLQYFGSIGAANDLELLIKAISIAVRDLNTNVKVRIVGDGTHEAKIEDLICDLELSEHVKISPPVPKVQVSHEMTKGDALFFVIKDLPDLWQYGISPNKVFGSLASGQWIIAAVNVPGNPLQDAPEVQICFPEPHSIAEAINAAASMSPKIRATLGRRNLDYVSDNFSFPVLAEKLATGLNRLVS